ncbi:MAG TPA: methionyl-tRNA formyltransferase [Spirochaetota bacterium]|nr:methionyl-tRNA formyltransferase [Spirochaetota bacterium]
MKIGFFGTPEIGAYCMKALFDEFEVLCAVTGPDKKSGRNREVHFSSVKEAALARNIPVLQPEKLRDGAFLNELKSFGADIYVVVAYGKIIPREVFDQPRYKTINLHPSLLPKYRGAAPIQWALVHGEKETGITVQCINEELDAGDILMQETIALDESMTAEDLYQAVLPAGADLLIKTLHGLEEGTIVPSAQDHNAASYCGKIDRDTARISWDSSARDIHNLVRGFNPKPVAWTEFRGKNMRVWKTMTFSDSVDFMLRPGEVRGFQKKRLLAGTGEGIIEIISIQPENKKAMEGLAFINGYRLVEGESFG